MRTIEVMASLDLGPREQATLSRDILNMVASGERRETLRIHRSRPVVAFGRRDVVSPGYQLAREAAAAHGFASVERLAGGRAAVFHEGTLAFAWAIPAVEPRVAVEQRFEELAEIMCDAFTQLGVDARIGEVPGEYCPGSWSVNARGKFKIMGVGQRLVGGAAHVGGVVVVEGADRIVDVLTPVYRALDLTWDPGSAGSLRSEVDTLTMASVERAILSQFGRRFELSVAAGGRLPDITP